MNVLDAATRRTVRERAGNRCECCGLHQDQSPLAALHVEHILPKKHGGTDELDNLALACIDRNLHKGSNVAGYAPETGALTDLFHPRRHAWTEHCLWDLIAMQDELTELFGRPVDLVEREGLRIPFRRQRILETRQVIYAGGQG